LQAVAKSDLVSLAKAGDEVAFEALLRPLLNPAYKLACVMLQDAAAAQDAVQEAAFKSWRHIDQLRPGAAIQPWFFGVVANECRSLRRKRWWSVLKGYSAHGEADAPLRDVDLETDVQRALSRLTAESRLVVTLHYYFDMSLEDIAHVVKLKPAGVRSRLYRALGVLKASTELGDLKP
jgi:RNA polymerase sigma-70 factor (ECF subfamily)